MFRSCYPLITSTLDFQLKVWDAKYQKGEWTPNVEAFRSSTSTSDKFPSSFSILPSFSLPEATHCLFRLFFGSSRPSDISSQSFSICCLLSSFANSFLVVLLSVVRSCFILNSPLPLCCLQSAVCFVMVLLPLCLLTLDVGTGPRSQVLICKW